MDWNTFQKQSSGLYDKLYNSHVEYYNFWKNNIVFTWRWWITLLLILTPWIIWLLIKKKESTDRLLYAGFFVMVSSSIMDMTGVAMGLWRYPITVFPFMSQHIAFDIFALPGVTMLLIQWFRSISPYIKAVIYSLSSSFIFDPFIEWLGLYKQLHWKYYYSVPIMFFLYLLANYISSRNEFEKLK